MRGTPEDVQAVAPENYHDGNLDPRLKEPRNMDIMALCDCYGAGTFACTTSGGSPYRAGGRDHVPGSDVHFGHRAQHDEGSWADPDPDELRLQRVHAGVRHIRDPQRLVGRPRRHAAGTDPHRDMVVHVYHADRRRVELRVPAGHALSFRRRGGRLLAQCGPDHFALVPRVRARHRAGFLFHGRAPGGRFHAGCWSPSCWGTCPGGGCSRFSVPWASCGPCSGAIGFATNRLNTPRCGPRSWSGSRRAG